MTKNSYETIKLEKENGITWLMFNRPEKRNAMNPKLHQEMYDAVTELETDDETEVLVLTGAGESWSAGMDLKEYFRELDDKPKERKRANWNAQQWRLDKLSVFPKPTIAMVNGFCFGGAFMPLIACDLAIASEDAIFGLSEINWGILPGGMVTKVVADVMCSRDALYYIMTGDSFDGRKASEIRLVNYAVPKEKLRDETIALCEKLKSKNPTTLRCAKQAYKMVRTMDNQQAADYLAAKLFEMRFTDKEKGRDKGLSQFLDEKSYRPGFEGYKRAR